MFRRESESPSVAQISPIRTDMRYCQPNRRSLGSGNAEIAFHMLISSCVSGIFSHWI